MTKRFSITEPILWLFVILMGITMGAGIYEARVLVPLWSAAAPDSVIAFYHHNAANPQFAPDQGGNFWVIVTPLTTLTTIALLISSFWTQGLQRKLLVGASVTAMIVQAATFAWFVPNIIRLFGSDVLTMNRDEITTLVSSWVNLNWLRAVLLFTAWTFSLLAIRLSTRQSFQ